MSVILGLDPGLATTGYGLIEVSGKALTALDYGVLTTPASSGTAQRLQRLYREVEDLIERQRPAEVAIELFVARNLRTALAVGQGRGVAILAAAQKGLPVYEYSPSQVKLAVCGYGRGEKRQIQEMVRLQLGLTALPQPDDAADDLAIAICHIYERRRADLIAEYG